MMRLVELDPDEVTWEDWAKRSLLDEPFIDELARSIKEHGQAAPIRVRVVEGRYVGVSGYQRWLACKKAGVKVRAEVVDMEDRAAALSHLEENAYRDDLHPLDLARKVDYAIRTGASVEEVERACRKDVTKLRFLLELPPKVQERLGRLPKERVPYTKLYELRPLLGRVSEDELLSWVEWVVRFNPSKEELTKLLEEAVEGRRPEKAEGVRLPEVERPKEEARAEAKPREREAEELRRELEDRDRKIQELTRLLEEARAKAAEEEAAARAEDALALFREASTKLVDYARQSPTAARRAVEAFEEAAERLLSHELLAVMDREKRDRVVNAMLRRAGVAKHDYCPICYGDLKRGDPVVVHRGCLEKAGFR